MAIAPVVTYFDPVALTPSMETDALVGSKGLMPGQGCDPIRSQHSVTQGRVGHLMSKCSPVVFQPTSSGNGSVPQTRT
eukprot:779314-Prymnesium_polylepis.2